MEILLFCRRKEMTNVCMKFFKQGNGCIKRLTIHATDPHIAITPERIKGLARTGNRLPRPQIPRAQQRL